MRPLKQLNSFSIYVDKNVRLSSDEVAKCWIFREPLHQWLPQWPWRGGSKKNFKGKDMAYRILGLLR